MTLAASGAVVNTEPTTTEARLAPRFLRVGLGRPFGEGGGLALAGTGRLIKLAAEALVLGLQLTQAPQKGLAAGTRDGLHTCIMGEVPTAAAPPRPRGTFHTRSRLHTYARGCTRTPRRLAGG
jgi:hypothetical protein